MNKAIYVLAAILFLMAVYLLGASPTTPLYLSNFPTIKSNLRSLEDSINKTESSNPAIKINNQARIVWADSAKLKTKWAIVYLHGFTASQMEGDPVHRIIANTYGMNLYLARLSDHGLNSDSALVHLTPDRLWESAKKALAIGEKIGEKVLIMSTSTGGTLALKLAEMYPTKVAALVNYSANVQINNLLAPLLNNHWGLAIVNAVSDHGFVDNSQNSDSAIAQYWTLRYKTEALPQLEELIETTMQAPVFAKITCPVLNIAYYKDDAHQDPTIKVADIKWMHSALGTAANAKKYVEIASVKAHPMASGLRSKDIEAVVRETKLFIENTLCLRN